MLAHKRFIDFDAPGALNDLDYYRLTVISEADFSIMLPYIKKKVRNTTGRSAKTCIIIFLINLRVGISQ